MKTILYSFASLIHKILFSSLQDKIHIFVPLYNIVYISIRYFRCRMSKICYMYLLVVSKNNDVSKLSLVKRLNNAFTVTSHVQLQFQTAHAHGIRMKQHQISVQDTVVQTHRMLQDLKINHLVFLL